MSLWRAGNSFYVSTEDNQRNTLARQDVHDVISLFCMLRISMTVMTHANLIFAEEKFTNKRRIICFVLAKLIPFQAWLHA